MINKIIKQLGTVEDLSSGLGTVQQARKSGLLTLTKVNVSELNGIYSVNTLEEFNLIDPNLLGDIKVVNVIEEGRTYSWDGTTWLKSSLGGQFVDKGTEKGKAIAYLANTTAENEDIVIKEGTNAFAIDNITIADGTTITIEDGAVFKVL